MERSHTILALIILGGWIATLGLAAWRWRQRLFRFLPFAFVTAAAVIGMWGSQSATDIIVTLVIANALTGGVLIALWLELRRR